MQSTSCLRCILSVIPLYALPDSPSKRCSPIPIFNPNVNAPLLLHPIPLYQDTVGPQCTVTCFHLLPQDIRRNIWRHSSWQGLYYYPFEIYLDKPLCEQGEDDGSIFTTFLKESRLPLAMKNVTWETIRDILAKYKVCPVHLRRPIVLTSYTLVIVYSILY